MGAPIERVAIAGAGTMGCGIAIAFADAGVAVRLFDAAPEALDRARATIATTYDAQVRRGKRNVQDAAARVAAIELRTDTGAFADADLAIEAVFEDLAIKRDVFARFGSICHPHALLATNTSTLDIDAIVSESPHPERSLGLHFFSPANVMKLVEVVRGAKTSPETLARASAICASVGKRPVVVGNCDGFVGNRMLLGYRREAERIVLAGASPQRVDGAIEAFGFAMGPFAVSDLAGIDIGYRAKQERIKRGAQPPFAVTDLSDAFFAAGRLGQKTGAGYYRYEAGDRTRRPDVAADAIVAERRAHHGIEPRDFTDDEIVDRLLFALAMEGGRILDEGIASSADDIDTIWVDGYGFPKAHGGPMAYARSRGLSNVARKIAEYRRDDPAFWRDSALFR